MAKKYYWLKLKFDWFDSKIVKKLRRIAGGDTYTIIYLKMQLLSLKNEGKIYYEGIEDNFIAELALDLDEDEENVKVTVQFLQRCGLLEAIESDEYLLTEVPSNIGSETASAERVRKHRSNKNKKLLEQNALHCNDRVTMCNGRVTMCNTEIEIEKELNIEKEIKKEKEKEIKKEIKKEKELIVSKDTIRSTDVQRIIDAWNSLNLTNIKKIAPETQRMAWLKKRIKDYGMEEVLRAIEQIRCSEFLQGVNKSGWQITFDWFIRPNNFPKVLDGQYADDKKKESGVRYDDAGNPWPVTGGVDWSRV